MRGKIRRSEKLKRLNSAVILLRNTTWKCGRIEAAIVKHLRQVRIGGRASLRDILKRLNLELVRNRKIRNRKTRRFSDIWESVQRLQDRRIVEVRTDG